MYGPWRLSQRERSFDSPQAVMWITLEIQWHQGKHTRIHTLYGP